MRNPQIPPRSSAHSRRLPAWLGAGSVAVCLLLGLILSRSPSGTLPQAVVTPDRAWRNAYVAAKQHRWTTAHSGFSALAERDRSTPEERKFARDMLVAIEAEMARVGTVGSSQNKP
jgi:hypothetical protein